ncbi:hypothetical protein [Oenococcus kitaharae]|uniref:Uncharacterized protein n=1 Tax=Oenococcus kitaharae DSM 17330 TaxID=1045004 RepID=G9WJR0_9LACO|nr:hypothetical protein [Oenococcus kitaharae]EHN59259.1 hypothetical protein OKIT_1161 [Oenococcus kitaharae DSM 17330]OEY82214.1 hypothetical protein NT96_07530 [Oenococcus kitaharae]OEY82637.1 hypothetical protein NV75_07975 [Oenococcus kitaharae]OEY84894.1 hypothetical protein NT95_00570 [Oenococcus kitaharae]
MKNKHFLKDLLDTFSASMKSEFDVIKKAVSAVKMLIKIMPEQKQNIQDMSDELEQTQDKMTQLQSQLTKDQQSLQDELSTVKYPFHKK